MAVNFKAGANAFKGAERKVAGASVRSNSARKASKILNSRAGASSGRFGKVINEKTKSGAQYAGKQIMGNIKQELGTTAKSIGTGLGKGAIGNAVGGAVIGAGINTVRGENAWDGAKTGAMLGGGWGVAKTGVKAGLGITGQADKTIAAGAKDMSKSVKSYLGVQSDARVWEQVKNAGRR